MLLKVALELQIEIKLWNSSCTLLFDDNVNRGIKVMKHIQDKNDWLSYEFKPYFFFLLAMISLFVKKNLPLTNGQNFIAYISIAVLFASGVKIILWRNEYRRKTSRN